jgi:DNA-binding Lrp family transcriptional regulator
MEKLDLKDRKILYHLDFDSRQSFRSLGRKVGLSKDVVTSRVKKLQEMKIIQGYNTIIDHAKLGYSLYRFYFSFQNVNPLIKKEIIEYFINDRYTDSVRLLEGNYDLIVSILVKNFPEAQTFWQKTIKKYGKYFSKKIFTAFCQSEYYGHRFLFDKNDKNPIKIYQWFDTGQRIKINELDYKIINKISHNARIQTTEIANALNSTSTIIYKRLKKILASNIIIAYRLNINYPKLGFYMYKIDIGLNQLEKLDKISNFIKTYPNFSYMCKTIGYVDLEVGFILQNPHQLNEIMEDLSKKYPDVIKNYSYFSGIQTYKAFKFQYL